LKPLKFKIPGPDGEKLFIRSFDTTVVAYNLQIIAIKRNDIGLPNIDYDTGKPTHAGEYPLTDQAYDQLLLDLHCKCFDALTPSLKANILAFYAHRQWTTHTKKENRQVKQIQCALEQLKATAVK